MVPRHVWRLVMIPVVLMACAGASRDGVGSSGVPDADAPDAGVLEVSVPDTGSPAPDTTTVEPEALAPLTGTEIRYLGFQIFEGGADPAIPFDGALIYTPRDKVAAVVHDIVTTVGETGSGRARLAFILGPIAFDHTDAEARQIIADGFAIALAENIAVGFHLDDSMFWSKRAGLTGDTSRRPSRIHWRNLSCESSAQLRSTCPSVSDARRTPTTRTASRS